MIRHSISLTACVVLAALSVGLLPDGGRDARAAEGRPRLGAPVRDERHSFHAHVTSWQELQWRHVVRQQQDYSCGAAALATLLRYHWGDRVGETEILRQLVAMLPPAEMKDRVENGLSLTDLRLVSVRMGYLASIGRLEFQELREAKSPLVVGIVLDDYNHFVVYRGMDCQYVYLADPVRGNVRTPINEFLDQWQKNAALVVVKKGVEPERRSPLTVRADETFLGEVNRLYLRDRIADVPPPSTR
jgi:predicted double-glycine peptidase